MCFQFRLLKLSMLIQKHRPGAESGNPVADNDDNDSVELEKSNVLLMGPTGSGTSFAL